MSKEDEIINKLHQEASTLLKTKKSDEEIIRALCKNGIERFYAETILENVKNDKNDQKGFYNHVLGGAFLTIAGILMTYLSYQYAETGGFYLVLVGITASGIIMMARGFILFKK